VVLVLLKELHRDQTKTAGYRHEHSSLLATPDQRAIGKLPGAFSRGSKTYPRLGCLPGPQLARIGDFRADKDGLGRGIGSFRDQHDLAGHCITLNLDLRARSDGADVRCRNGDLDP
jgi:hypothetical protein